MKLATSRNDREPPFYERWGEFLGTELAPFPGRAHFMVRMLVANSLVILIAMTLQVPMTALAVVSVISTIQSNVVLTRLTGILTLIALVLAIGTTLLLVKFTFDYPMLRIAFAALIYFGCMYLMRAMKLGIIFSGVGLVVIYAQSMVDSMPYPEIVTRYILWAMMATVLGTVTALFVNSFVLQRSPGEQMAEEAHARLVALGGGLAVPDAPVSVRAMRLGMDKLQKLFQFACMSAPKDETLKLYRQSWIGIVSRVRYGVNALSAADARAVPASALLELATQLETLDAAIAGNAPYRFALEPAHRAALEGNANTVAVLHALDAFADFNAGDAAIASPQRAAAKEPMWQPDARTNPVYVQFSLKALIASLIGYLVFVSTQWEGIHTIMISVSLLLFPTLGMSLQRMPLRLIGVMLGSLVAIALTVFVMPHLDSIVGLLLMLAPVFLIGGWIAGGPERTAYIGVQIIGTGCLPLLEDFGPSYDLTEVRDRAIGIVLGIVVSAVVFSCLWPESERGALRQKLAALLRQIAALVRAEQQRRSASERQQALVGAWSTLNECEAMYGRTVNEADFRAGSQVTRAGRARALLDQARRILLAQDDVHSALAAAPDASEASRDAGSAIRQVLDQTGDALYRYADAIAQSEDPQRVRPQLPIAVLDAVHGGTELPARLRRLLDEVAGLPDNEHASHVPLQRIEGPAS
ncbi:FUSC family protein [Candidatus Burkholderia verschuerenii]|nr:FUSC family protein [Candidatus Burkholderia verschuerenii]